MLAVLVLIGAAHIADLRVLALALAFLTLSGLFFVHGLATPGIIAPDPNGWVGATARIGLFAGAWFLAASTLEERVAIHRTLLRLRGRILLVTSLLLLLTGFVAVMDLVTLRVMGPLERAPLLQAVGQAVRALSTGWTTVSFGVASIALLLITAVHYWRVERRWSSPLVRGLLVAGVFLLQAQVSLLLAPVWHVSWWEYHVLLLLAYAVALISLVREYALHGTWRGVVEGLLLRDALEHLERGYTEVIAALAAVGEAKDVYTKGHSVRVARLAALIARELGLPPERERILYQAAILHDLGKMEFPQSSAEARTADAGRIRASPGPPNPELGDRAAGPFLCADAASNPVAPRTARPRWATV
ncbi:HD domain-containing protein [Thermomicrobium sp. CFH 73360]|uniref:HD-GYP domain-containing protein n=1 Tax=Thermomicrobium sp. CFH 73360 TaxID=2951987 RepID=UPI00207689DC|nr:HD domain-containing protein [Thermomicrobium sp. CFH 73360]MCM8745435.1 HD domain-containing protein [Thermomicrobium sp. CFH 73360]